MFPSSLALYDEKMGLVLQEARQKQEWFKSTIERVQEELTFKRKVLGHIDEINGDIDAIRQSEFFSRRMRILKPPAAGGGGGGTATTSRRAPKPADGPKLVSIVESTGVHGPSHPSHGKPKLQAIRNQMKRRERELAAAVAPDVEPDRNVRWAASGESKTHQEQRQFSNRVCNDILDKDEEDEAATPDAQACPPSPSPSPSALHATTTPSSEFAILENLPEATFETSKANPKLKTAGFIVVGNQPKRGFRRKLFRAGGEKRTLELPSQVEAAAAERQRYMKRRRTVGGGGGGGGGGYGSVFFRFTKSGRFADWNYPRRFGGGGGGDPKGVSSSRKSDPYEMISVFKSFGYEQLVAKALLLAKEDKATDEGESDVDEVIIDTTALVRRDNDVARCALNVVEAARYELRRVVYHTQRGIADLRSEVTSKIKQLESILARLIKDRDAHAKKDHKAEFVIDALGFTEAHSKIMSQFRRERDELYALLERPATDDSNPFLGRSDPEFKQALENVIQRCGYRLDTLNIKFMLQFMPERLTSDEIAVFSSYPAMSEPLNLDTRPDRLMELGVASGDFCIRCLDGVIHGTADSWIWVCTSCGHQQSRQAEHFNYEDYEHDYSKPGSTSYQRLNHFMDRLCNLFADSPKTVRAEVMAAIEYHIKSNEASSGGEGGEGGDDSALQPVLVPPENEGDPPRYISAFRSSIDNIAMKGTTNTHTSCALSPSPHANGHWG